MTNFSNPAVKAAFDSFPVPARKQLLKLRELIFKVASTTEGVGPIEESLRWGEPAYLTPSTKAGSPIRLASKAKAPNQFAIYFICTTNLIQTFRTVFADDFTFEKNRAIVFEVGQKMPLNELALCFQSALTYHLKKGG
jgi:Domain of unknown function (DU1801)